MARQGTQSGGTRRGYKQTEIGEIPVEWECSRLSDITKAIKRKNSAGVKRVLTISGEQGLIDQRLYFNRSVAGNDLSGYYYLKNGEFAYNRSSMKGYPFGAIKRLDRYPDGVVSTLYTCFEITEKVIDADFLQCVFDSGLSNKQLSLLTQIGGRAHGLLNITASEFFGIQIPLPPLPEQKKIATILSSVDDAIRSTQAVIDQARTLKKGLLGQLLTRGIGHKKFKQTEIGEIPVEWEVKTLGEVSATVEYGVGESAIPWNESNPRYLRITDIDDDSQIVQSARVSVPDLDYGSSFLQEGDLLIARTGNTVGKSYLFRTEDFCESKVVFAGYLIRFRLKSMTVMPRFIFAITQSPYFLKWVMEKKRVGAQPNVNASEYSSLQIPLPPLPEQKQIAEILSGVDAVIRQNSDQVEQLKRTKAGLMQDLLTGRKRVAV